MTCRGQAQRRTVARIAAALAVPGVDGADRGSAGGKDPGGGDGGPAEGQEAAREAAEGLLRRTVAWFGCYLVGCGPYPSPPVDGSTGGTARAGRHTIGPGSPVDGSDHRQAGPDGVEDAEGEGGWAAERILVRHLRGRTSPKALRAGAARADTPPRRDSACGVQRAEQ